MPQIIVNVSPPKCGTTSLYFALVASRDIASSKLKEPRFFAGPATDDPQLPDAMRTGGNYGNGREWHDALFEDADRARYRIDFTTYYAVTADTPELLGRHYSDPRLMFVMRDPVARFISQYYQYRKMGIRVPPLEEVIRGGNPVSDLMYRFSDYRATWVRYARAFGEDALLALDFRLLKSAHATVGDACNAFLDLNDIVYAPNERDKNVAGQPRLAWLQRAMFSDTVRGALQGLAPGAKTKLLRLRKKAVLANVKARAYPPVPEEMEALLSERLAGQREFYVEKCPGEPAAPSSSDDAEPVATLRS